MKNSNLNTTVLTIFGACILFLMTLIVLVKVNNRQVTSTIEMQKYLRNYSDKDTFELSMDEYVKFDVLHLKDRNQLNVFWTVAGELIIYTSYQISGKNLLLITRPTTMEKGNLLNDDYFSLVRLETAVKSKSRCIYISTDSERMFEIAENATHMFKGRKMYGERKFSFINSNGCEVIYEFTELPEIWAEDKR